MNEVINISISGIAFILDIEAYKILDKYIKNLEKSYKSNPDGKEIIADIEARIVELILSHQTANEVVSTDTINHIVSQLGMPEDMPFEESGDRSVSFDSSGKSFPRRLYREKDSAKLGGVCSGLGRYFDTDPVIFRIGIFTPLFLLIIFSAIGIFHDFTGVLGSVFGAFILLYIVLWISTPIAITPRQKLEMQGKKITASEIERVMSEEAYSISSDPRSASVFAKLFTIIGHILLFSIKLIAIIIGFSFAVAAIAIIVSMVAIILGKDIGVAINDISINDPGFILNGISGVSAKGFVMMALGVIVIPIIIFTLFIFRFVFNLKTNSTILWVLSGAWILLTVYTLIITLDNLDKIKENVRYMENNYSYYNEIASDNNIDRYDDSIEKIELLVIGGNTIIKDDIVINSENFKKFGTLEVIDEKYTGTILTSQGDTIVKNNVIINMEKTIPTIRKMTFGNDYVLNTVSAGDM